MGFAFLGRLATAVLGILSEDSQTEASASVPTSATTTSSSTSSVMSSPEITSASQGQGISSKNGLCTLCENGLDDMLWPVTTVESSGSTCASLALDAAVKFSASSSQCQAHIDKWRHTCCGNTPPKSVAVVVPEREPIRKTGPYPRCGVCHNGDYPTAAGMVLTVLYIGSGSCVQFETMGQQGNIPTHMCAPIQYFGYEPCGCGEFKREDPVAYGLVEIPFPTLAPSPAPSEAQVDTTVQAARGEGFYSNDESAGVTLGSVYDANREESKTEDEITMRSGESSFYEADGEGIGGGGLRKRNLKGQEKKEAHNKL